MGGGKTTRRNIKHKMKRSKDLNLAREKEADEMKSREVKWCKWDTGSSPDAGSQAEGKRK